MSLFPPRIILIANISYGVLEDMSLASRVLEDTFSSPWSWPCLESQVLGLGLVKFSMTHRFTDTATKKVLMIRAKTVINVSSFPS